MSRPKIPDRVKVNVVLQQAGGWVTCPLCEGPLRPADDRILEHMVPRELGGSDEEENLRWVHRACAAKKTNGSKATAAGGDLHKIAKTKRLALARQLHHAVVVLGERRPASKIQSRGFDKRWTRKMNGRVVRNADA